MPNIIKSFLKKVLIIISISLVIYLSYVFIFKPDNIQTKLLKSITKKELLNVSRLNILPKEIKGNVVTLKRFDLKYFNDFHKIFSKEIRKAIEYPEKITFGFTKSMLLHDMKLEREGKGIFYFIFNNKDNKLIGWIEIKDKNIEDPGQFSISINENYRGKGRAQEAIQIISDIYFKYKDEDEYIAHVRLWNQRSYKALIKAGFKDVDRFYEDGEPTRYILKMYNSHKTKSDFTK
ncbi:MAG: GNAT family N-acetyltransferase [bacterium]